MTDYELKKHSKKVQILERSRKMDKSRDVYICYGPYSLGHEG